ncbi:MAG TPA: ABC transporter permease, partial [Anaerolineae bacterium]|nr:ABC transporter permease [Anaerolineae bacterium]
MGTLKHKIWHDLWKNKGRTLQVVLIIAMGAAALGMIISVRSLMIPAMQDGWQAINPAMMNFGVFPGLDDDDLIAISKIDGVTEVDGLLNTTIEWRVSPEDEWAPGQLTARSDYNNQNLNKIELLEGNWPHDRIFAVETGHESHFNIPDRKLSIRVNRREHKVQLDGVIYNQITNPVSFGGNMQLYTTRERFKELTGQRDFTQLMANAAEYDKEAVTALADQIQERLEKQGKSVYSAFPGRVTDPNKHFFQDSMDGLFYLLGVMGLLALILGLLLVYNTITAIIAQQVEQIGIMKAIGATTGKILL